MTNGIPITLRVASRRIKIPNKPIISSTGITKFSLIFILSSTPPRATN